MEERRVIPRDLFFASPIQFWNLLWLLFFAALILYSAFRRKNLVAPSLRPLVISGRDPYLTGFRLFALFLAWILGVLALMEPLGNESYPKALQGTVRETKTPIELFFLIDVSQSMAVQDVRSSVSRLKKAVEVADALAKELYSDPIALYAFTSKALAVVPLTYDGIFVRMMLRELVLNQGDATGTLIGNALFELKNEGLSQYPKAPKAVILFSDGGDNLGQEAPLIKIASELKVPIFAVGIGSVEGGVVPDVLHEGKQVTSHLEEKILKAIADASGGKYISAYDLTAADIASRIAQGLAPFRLKVSEAGLLQFSQGYYKPYFQIPLGIAILLFLVFAFMPYGRKGIALIVFSSLYSQNPGEDLYDAGKYKEAADWYSGEIKNLPVPWLRDKLFYDIGVSLAAKEGWNEATDSFFMVSKDAYTYPLFRLRLVYSRLLALLETAKKENRPDLLQEGLWMLQILDPPQDSPLNDVKKTFQMELGRLSDQPGEVKLDSLIRTLQLADSLSRVDVPALRVISGEESVYSLIKQKEKEAKEPIDFLQAAILSLRAAGPEAVFQDGGGFYPLVNQWQKVQFEKGECLCEPWKEALPIFTEGLEMQRAGTGDSQMPYTYSKWSEALALLKRPPSGGKSQEEEKESKEDLQELQGMQDLDRQFQKPPKPKEGEGMKW